MNSICFGVPMSTFNKVIIMGNLTRDLEVRVTPSGATVAETCLAMNRKSKVGGEMKDETTFIDVTFWNKSAEIAERFLSKGKPALVEGRLQQDTWQDKETGQNRSKIKVVADRLTLVGGKDGDGERAPAGAGAESEAFF